MNSSRVMAFYLVVNKSGFCFIIGCYLFVGSTPTSGNAACLSQLLWPWLLNMMSIFILNFNQLSKHINTTCEHFLKFFLIFSLLKNSVLMELPAFVQGFQLSKVTSPTAINFFAWVSNTHCNSLFRGLSCFNQHKLQSIQNTLAHIVTNHRKYAHVTPIPKKLHWFLLSTNQSLSQSNIRAIVLPLMLLRSGMNSLMMCAVQHQLPPSERSSKLTCLQKPIPHSLPCHPCVPLVWLGYVLRFTLTAFLYVQMCLRVHQWGRLSAIKVHIRLD